MHLNMLAKLRLEFYLHQFASQQCFHGGVQPHPLIEHRNVADQEFALLPLLQLQRLLAKWNLEFHPLHSAL